MNTQNSQVADLQQAIHLLDQAANILYKLDIRLSDFNAVIGVLANLEEDLVDLLESGQL